MTPEEMISRERDNRADREKILSAGRHIIAVLIWVAAIATVVAVVVR